MPRASQNFVPLIYLKIRDNKPTSVSNRFGVGISPDAAVQSFVFGAYGSRAGARE